MSAAAPIQGAGAAVGAFGSLIQGQSESNNLNRAATIEDQNAQLDIEAGNTNAAISAIHSQKQIGSITAGYGANGISSDSGSALAVLAASTSSAELDRQNILHGAQVRAVNYENQASMDRIGATSALEGSYLNAIAGVVTGGSKMFGTGAGVQPGQYTPVTTGGQTGGAGNYIPTEGYDE